MEICKFEQCRRMSTQSSEYCKGHECSNCHRLSKYKKTQFCQECKCQTVNCARIKHKDHSHSHCSVHACNAYGCHNPQKQRYKYCDDHRCYNVNCGGKIDECPTHLCYKESEEKGRPRLCVHDSKDVCLTFKCEVDGCEKLKFRRNVLYCENHCCMQHDYMNNYCQNQKIDGSRYCLGHTCKVDGCRRDGSNGKYCYYHTCTFGLCRSLISESYGDDSQSRTRYCPKHKCVVGGCFHNFECDWHEKENGDPMRRLKTELDSLPVFRGAQIYNSHCPVCLNPKATGNLIILSCGHAFCRSCLLILMKRDMRDCSVCRATNVQYFRAIKATK